MTATQLVDDRPGTRTWASHFPGWCPSLPSIFPSVLSQEGLSAEVGKGVRVGDEAGERERKREGKLSKRISLTPC